MRKFILSLLTCLTCLTACHDDTEGEKYEVTARTVLIYMAGENNLASSGFLHSDLLEIQKGSKFLSDNQRLFVFVDSLNSKTSRNPYIIEMHDGKCEIVYEYSHEFYSCDPDYFKEVIQQVFSMAPAESYGLVLWGHASGWVVTSDSIAATRAYGQDTGSNGNQSGTKWMNITQMAKALEDLPKMEFIFADCCNMMCAEVGYELRHATNYLIGSPAEIPGNGAPYDMIIPLLYKEDGELYHGIIDTYFDYYKSAYQYDWDLQGHSVPLSVIDTRHVEQLAEETATVLEKFTDGYPYYPAYPDLAADSIAYYLHSNAPVMYDMRAFIKTHVDDADFQQWDEVYQQTVPYYRMSMKWMTIYPALKNAFGTFNQDLSRYGCVSMFIPQNTSSYFYGNYIKTFNYYGWNRVIDWSRFGWD